MQNKGAIRFFTIVLALVSIYQLLFTVFAQKVERDAKKYAQGDVRLERSYLDSMKSEVVYNVLVKKYTYQDCKEREINMGLDLKGGMNVILEIAVEDIIRSLAAPQFLTDPVFTETMSTAQQMKQSSTRDFIDIFAEAFETNNPGGQLAQFFMTPETRGDIDFNTTNSEVVVYLKREAEDAINNSYNVLRNRIDKFGVVQLNIQKMERQGRILIELPGVKEPERVAKLLTGTANLEFWTTYQNVEIWREIEQANNALAGILKAEDMLGADEFVAEEVTGALQEDILTGEEESLFELQDEELLLDTTGLDFLSDIDTSADFSTEEAQFIRENPLFAILRPYVDNTGNLIQTCVV
ncbi:MAG TPA: protein translocase subunit SecDF, partial [Bacteroidaceae bacterium]|nr:protein translocase subunit SecDF [Bacteroidaceae bacterium]